MKICQNENIVFIDAHIHIHDCFNIEEFFSCAETNFKNQANALKINYFQSLLCLTEPHGVNVFESFKNLASDNKNIGNWNIGFTKRHNTLVLRKNDFCLYVLAGRQIVTEENLEVLAIGLEEEIEDGKPIHQVLDYVNSSKSIPIIPWGVGKWTGRRREILEEIILQKQSFPIYLGDNGNRPWFMQKSKLFKLASLKSIINLPGSDPLPFDREVQKPGSFGFVLDGVINEDDPFDSICKIIKNNSIQFKSFGKLESFFPFMKNQVAMQLVKRKRKK